MANRKGSVLIVVLCGMTLMSMLCLSYWYSSYYLFYSCFYRAQSIYRENVTYLLLRWSIAWCKQVFGRDDKQNIHLYPQKISVPSWPVSESPFSALVTIDKNKNNGMVIQAELLMNSTVIHTMKCILEKGKGEKFFIRDCTHVPHS